jgi:hypothetical protein
MYNVQKIKALKIRKIDIKDFINLQILNVINKRVHMVLHKGYYTTFAES